MKKIVIDCRMWGDSFGGIGRYTKEITSNLILNRSDWHFKLIGSSFMFTDIESLGYTNVDLILFDAPIFSFKEQLFFIKHDLSCDIFWSPYINVPFLNIKAKKRVVTIHDVFHLANPNYFSYFRRLVINPYYFFARNKSDVILTVSNFSRDEITRLFGQFYSNKTKVIYNGCDINNFSNEPISVKSNYILFVGNIKPHKNLKNALLAFSQLNNSELKFVIVGKREGFITADKKVFPLIELLNSDFERVVFTGNISDDILYSYYKNASLLIMPSFYEGFGLPIVEAMHFGLPIVCSEIPVFKEIGGDALIYFNPSSIESICDGIKNGLETSKNISYKNWISWSDTAKQVSYLFENI